jgi:hypothetical protein
MKTLVALLAIGVLLAACDDTHTALSPDGSPSPDAGSAPDQGQPPDLALPDAPGPLANVYVDNPLEDKKQTTQVLLQHVTDPEGLLNGPYVRVWNCVNEAGGETINIGHGTSATTGKMCPREQRAKPGPDGTYLQITPPAVDADGHTSFAEIMMYHHVTTIHDHYRDSFGLSWIDKPLRAIVNLQTYSDKTGTWSGYANAAYMPKVDSGSLVTMLGVDLLQGDDGIVFGYLNGDVNFSFDASVIYHEYTHFVMGGQVLLEYALDKYGVDPTPPALNEALADYFASSYLKNPKLGSYSLGSQMRDLTRVLRCPDHLVGESHYDGEVASGAFWGAREILGVDVADHALWNMVLTFTKSTTFELAATAALDEIKKLAPDKVEAVKEVFVDRGMLGCTRLREYADFDTTTGGALSPGYPGKSPEMLIFPDGVPAYSQNHLTLLDTTKELTIDYTVGGNYGGTQGTLPDVAVALRRGADPITYDYSSGKAVSSAHATLKGADDGTGKGYRLVLSGACIKKGDLVFQFMNRGTRSGRVRKIQVTQSATVTNPAPNFDLCP